MMAITRMGQILLTCARIVVLVEWISARGILESCITGIVVLLDVLLRVSISFIF